MRARDREQYDDNFVVLVLLHLHFNTNPIEQEPLAQSAYLEINIHVPKALPAFGDAEGIPPVPLLVSEQASFGARQKGESNRGPESPMFKAMGIGYA